MATAVATAVFPKVLTGIRVRETIAHSGRKSRAGSSRLRRRHGSGQFALRFRPDGTSLQAQAEPALSLRIGQEVSRMPRRQRRTAPQARPPVAEAARVGW